MIERIVDGENAIVNDSIGMINVKHCQFLHGNIIKDDSLTCQNWR